MSKHNLTSERLREILIWVTSLIPLLHMKHIYMQRERYTKGVSFSHRRHTHACGVTL